YALADHFLARRAARNLEHCGGPSGRVGRQGDA
ncbi:xapx domain-containing protein, partial [Xanthomonas perforans]|nr:xapx domain-containing protein [Xanthomonas perforans]